MRKRLSLHIINHLVVNTVPSGVVTKYVDLFSYEKIQVDLEEVCRQEVYNLVNKPLEDAHGSNTRRNQAEG